MSTTAEPPAVDEEEPRVVRDATCTFCGCVCDDIDLTVQGHRITETKRACVLGRSWFLNHRIDEDIPPCRIDGEPATVDRGIHRAAEILGAARGARDVVHTLTRINRPDSTVHRKQYDDMEKGIEIVDFHTVKFNQDPQPGGGPGGAQ